MNDELKKVLDEVEANYLYLSKGELDILKLMIRRAYLIGKEEGLTFSLEVHETHN